RRPRSLPPDRRLFAAPWVSFHSDRGSPRPAPADAWGAPARSHLPLAAKRAASGSADWVESQGPGSRGADASVGNWLSAPVRGPASKPARGRNIFSWPNSFGRQKLLTVASGDFA